MTAITYTAKARTVGGVSTIASGHTAGNVYTIETESHQLDPNRRPVGRTSVSLNGETTGTLHRIDETWQILSDVVEQADQPYWDEFFASVMASEKFTLDPYGTQAIPDNPLSVVLEGEPNTKRVGATKMLQYSFRVRVVE